MRMLVHIFYQRSTFEHLEIFHDSGRRGWNR